MVGSIAVLPATRLLRRHRELIFEIQANGQPQFIRGLVSMNLMTQGALLSLLVINFQRLLFFVPNATVRDCRQQPGDETSQLIEVIRVR